MVSKYRRGKCQEKKGEVLDFLCTTSLSLCYSALLVMEPNISVRVKPIKLDLYSLVLSREKGILKLMIYFFVIPTLTAFCTYPKTLRIVKDH
jgi:hypothetical protein